MTSSIVDLKKAIDTVTETDPQRMEKNLKTIQSFKTPNDFNFSTCYDLSKPTSPAHQRIFAYASLTSIIKESWSFLNDVLRLQITATFPFANGADLEHDELSTTIARTAAAYLAYAAEIDAINNYFIPTDENAPHYPAKFLACTFSEMISFINSSDFPKSRFRVFSFMNSKEIPELLNVMLYKPLSEYEFGSPDYKFYIFLISEIHQNAPSIIEKHINQEYILEAYLNLCAVLWENTDVNVEVIFETLFVNSFCPRIIIDTLLLYVSRFTTNFKQLFYFDEEISSEEFSVLSQNFQLRLKILFMLMREIDPGDCDELLIIISECLGSISPSVICESAIDLLALLKSAKFINSSNFQNNCKGSRFRIFEVCMTHIIYRLNNLEGAFKDDLWSPQSTNAQLNELIRVLIEFYDGQDLVRDLFEAMLVQLGNVEVLDSHLKILTNSIGIPKLPSDFGTIAVRATIDLLSVINHYGSAIQSRISVFLTKLIPSLEFTEFDIDDFFLQLLDLLIESKPASYEPFIQYVLTFAEHFKDLKPPIEKLQAVKPTHTAYTAVTKLIAIFAKEGEYSIEQILTDAEIDLSWLNNFFDPHDPAHMKRLSISINNEFSIVSNIKALDESLRSLYKKVCALTVQSSNTLVMLNDHETSQRVSMPIISTYTNLSSALLKFASLDYRLFEGEIIGLQTPTTFNVNSWTWLKKIGEPLISALSKLPETRIAADNICLSYASILENNTGGETKDANRLAKNLVDVTQYASLAVAEKALRSCLNAGDLGVLSCVCQAVSERDFALCVNLFTDITKRRDNQSLDRISEMLCKLFSKSSNNISLFEQLPGATPESISLLKDRIVKVKTPKGIKRSFKTFIEGLPKI